MELNDKEAKRDAMKLQTQINAERKIRTELENRVYHLEKAIEKQVKINSDFVKMQREVFDRIEKVEHRMNFLEKRKGVDRNEIN